MGKKAIAKRLNDMNVPTKHGDPWGLSAITGILKNPAYTGRYTWRASEYKDYYIDGKKCKRKVKNPNPITIDGAIPQIVPTDTWNRVHDMFVHREKPKVNDGLELRNPLSGLIRCGLCGHIMHRTVTKDHIYASLHCPNVSCANRTIPLRRAVETVLEGLRGWTNVYTEPDEPETDTRADELNTANAQKAKLEARLKRMYDLLEDGVYTPQEFIARRDELKEKIESVDQIIHDIETAPPTIKQAIKDCSPKVVHILDAYYLTDSPAEQNTLLKSIVDHIDFVRVGNDPVKMTIYPKLLTHDR